MPKKLSRPGKDGFFPFTEESAVSAPLKSRDVVMQNEILFALNYAGIHDLWYSYDASQDNYYTINDVTSIYPSSDDFRKEYLVITNSNGYDISVKYADVDSENGGKVPMIRLSEMYLIAAESGFNAHKDVAIGLLEELRKNRGIAEEISTTITYDNFVKELTREARREFIGEGQLFYWYKRLGLPVDQGSTTITLELSQFCFAVASYGSRVRRA